VGARTFAAGIDPIQPSDSSVKRLSLARVRAPIKTAARLCQLYALAKVANGFSVWLEWAFKLQLFSLSKKLVYESLLLFAKAPPAASAVCKILKDAGFTFHSHNLSGSFEECDEVLILCLWHSFFDDVVQPIPLFRAQSPPSLKTNHHISCKSTVFMITEASRLVTSYEVKSLGESKSS
jgi:hypothetical protein